MTLTIEDIRNPKRRSGFNYVHYEPQGSKIRPYRAEKGTGGTTRVTPWCGPRRATAEEAAQDYCDYVASGQGVHKPRRLKSAGHKRPMRPQIPVPSDIEAARGMIRDYEAQVRGDAQGYVYLIIEVHLGGALKYGKIGYSVKPPARAAELQTGNPRILHLYAAKPGTEADERALQAKYEKHNVLGEWFEITKELLLEWDAEHLNVVGARTGRMSCSNPNINQPAAPQRVA